MVYSILKIQVDLQLKRLGKKSLKSLNKLDLNIVGETNLKTVNFLDITLNLSKRKYQSYNKPDNDPLCIDVNSNHPPKIPPIKYQQQMILSNDESKSSKTPCNGCDKTYCHGNCVQQNMIYCSKVIPRNEFVNKNHFLYIWLTESSLIDRLYEHKNSKM